MDREVRQADATGGAEHHDESNVPNNDKNSVFSVATASALQESAGAIPELRIIRRSWQFIIKKFVSISPSLHPRGKNQTLTPPELY